MLKNLLLISIRSLKKRKFFTVLNIGGLSTSPGPFVGAVAISIAFTAFALAYHTMKAASANPIEALRYE